MFLAVRRSVVVSALLLLVADGRCVLGEDPGSGVSRNQFVVGAEYSNNSNRLIIGKAYNRRFGGVDLGYERLLKEGRLAAWDYMVDVRPLVMLQDPVSTTTETVQFTGQPPYGPFLLQDGPIPSRCQSSVETNPGNIQPGVTTVETQRCGTRWTYGGGVSPLGQQVRFFPRRQLQPYLTVNAGFLMFTRDVPSYRSSAFNFTFGFGGGVMWRRSADHAWAVDYRVSHISNRGLGYANPGIDSQVIRVSCLFGRLPWL